MIRSGRFSFAKIQVTADNKFSEIGIMGIHRVFKTLVRDSKALKLSSVLVWNLAFGRYTYLIAVVWLSFDVQLDSLEKTSLA